MRKTPSQALRRALCAALVVLAAAASALSQSDGRGASPAGEAAAPSPTPAARDEKAEEVVRRAVEALGGGSYLGVRTIISRGYHTPFREGVGGLPVKFVDYIVFPDRERTEFDGAGIKSVQTNTGDTGWQLDLKAKKLSDMTPEQVREFKTTLRASLDNILRGWWRAEGAALAYAGRREAGVGRRNEVVRLTYPDGSALEFEFGARDNLPAKVRFKKQNKEGEQVEEEYRFAQFLNIGGISAPFIIDYYSAGVQSGRTNFEKVEFNQPVPDALFTRPADPRTDVKK